MLLFVLALAQAVAPGHLELVCSIRSVGRPVTLRFAIDENRHTFTGKSNDRAFGGTADFTDDKISLVDKGDRITWFYDLNRLTGQFEMSGALNGRSDRHSHVQGNCRKFTEPVF